jgi:hypothetical protein
MDDRLPLMPPDASVTARHWLQRSRDTAYQYEVHTWFAKRQCWDSGNPFALYSAGWRYERQAEMADQNDRFA